MPNAMVAGLFVLVALVALGFGYMLARLAIARRQERDVAVAEDRVAVARTEASKILAMAEDEARAKAEAYREREEAGLAHRRLELSNLESRLAQREESLLARCVGVVAHVKLYSLRYGNASPHGGRVA